MLQIYDLTTEYLRNPVGVDAACPRLSWKLKSDKRGVFQTGYHIIAKTGGAVIWDSGYVESAQNLNVQYAGEELQSRQQVTWMVQASVTDAEGNTESVETETASFEMGLLNPQDWSGQWIEPEDVVDPDERKPAPYLRKTFSVRPGLVRARIYQTAHGLYDFWINGMEGSEDRFKPGLTSYYYRIQYQIYDITALVTEGINVWAVMLGDGWWRGVTGGTVKNNFGYKLHYMGQIELFYDDGTSEVIASDESFRWARGGLRASDMHMGELYDARSEEAGWKLTGFDDSSWQPVHLTCEHTDAELIPCRSVPVREKEIFLPEEFTDANGRRILDFGQNIAGYVKMRLRDCQKGQKVTLVHGEGLKNGCFSTDNVSKCSIPLDAFQEVNYICSGESEEIYRPFFAIFGFRYVWLDGYDGEIRKDDFQAAAVYSDMEETGDFSCSNLLINQLVENSRWSQKGNFMDVPVDCPTRERNAWTGDAQIYARTAADFMNVYSFYEKWMQDLDIEQYESGKVGITFPSTSSVHNPAELERVQAENPMAALAGPCGDGSIGEDCAGWGDAAVWIPYMMYLCYGDKRILENQYVSARKWLDYMLACAREHNPLYEDQPQYQTRDEDGELDADYIYDTKMHYGEWNEPIPKKNTGETSLADIFTRMIKEGKPLVATAYMCRSAANVAHMAQILGNKEDAEKYSRLSKKIKRVYDKYLISEDGTIEPGHQAAYVRALVMELCSEKKRPLVVRQLVKEIEANEYCLNTGFLSTPFLLPVLVEHGYPELAFRILEQTRRPGWLHAVNLGSTTIPESWDAVEGFKESLNHYSYGAVCSFLFGYVAGIRPVFEFPGYKQFELKPVVGGSLTWAKAVFKSPYGIIRSEWQIKADDLYYLCTIPVNTQAKVLLPDGRCMELGSGDYQFICKRWKNP